MVHGQFRLQKRIIDTGIIFFNIHYKNVQLLCFLIRGSSKEKRHEPTPPPRSYRRRSTPLRPGEYRPSKKRTPSPQQRKETRDESNPGPSRERSLERHRHKERKRSRSPFKSRDKSKSPYRFDFFIKKLEFCNNMGIP